MMMMMMLMMILFVFFLCSALLTVCVLILFVCRSDRLLRRLFNSIKQPLNQSLTDADAEVMLDATFDYDWLHEVGSGVDDCPLPHHVSSAAEILSLIERIQSLIASLPRPAAITIARLG